MKVTSAKTAFPKKAKPKRSSENVIIGTLTDERFEVGSHDVVGMPVQRRRLDWRQWEAGCVRDGSRRWRGPAVGPSSKGTQKGQRHEEHELHVKLHGRGRNWDWLAATSVHSPRVATFLAPALPTFATT